MKKQLIIFTLLALLLSACSDYSDHRINIEEPPSFGIFEDINIELGVQGKDELIYSLQLLYKGKLLAISTITSSYKPSLIPVSIDFAKFQDKSIDFAADIINKNQIIIDIVLSNESHKIALDTSINISIRPLPISQPLSVELSNGKSDLTSTIQSSLIEVRKKYPNLQATKQHRVAFLNELLRQNKKGLHAEISSKQFLDPERS